MEYSIFNDYRTGLFHATLLGGEFGNCHGQGTTPEEALVSLKLTIRVRRKNNDN